MSTGLNFISENVELKHLSKGQLSALSLLMIGGVPPPVGGTTVLFKDLIDSLASTEDLSVRLINTSRSSNSVLSNGLHALKCLIGIIWNIPSASVVSFHSSMSGALQFGPLVHWLCQMFGKKWIFRGFGGHFEAWHQSLGWVHRYIFDNTVLNADAVLFERMSSVQYFRCITRRPVHWYPNSRRRVMNVSLVTRSQKIPLRFVYVGHVKPTKGIHELINASKNVPRDTVMVDVYGPLQEGISEACFGGSPVSYRGILAMDEVIKTLATYDVLILPTYWDGEGYPGVILEAYCAGIPVIATRWGGIPEIVTAETGILVEPRDVIGLANAMQTLIDSDDLLSRLRNGARSKAAEFDADRWNQYFIDVCHRLTAD